MPVPRLNILLDGRRLDPKVLALLTQFEIRESDSEPTVFTSRFKLVQEPTGEFFPLDDDVFGPASALVVDVVAPGGLPTRLFSGFVTHVRPHFEGIESNCYLELIGMDHAVLLDSEERVASYPDASDADAVEEILGRYGLVSDVERTSAVHRRDRQMLVQRGTDLDFVSMLARRNGCCFYFEHDLERDRSVGHFHRPRVDDAPQADIVILQSEENLRWIDFQLSVATPLGVKGAALDPLSKRVVRGTGRSPLTEQGEGGLVEEIEHGLQDAGSPGVGTLLRSPIPLASAIEAQSQASTAEARFVVEARGELDPALFRGVLRARRPVLIRGTGRRLSGSYYVRGVRTMLEGGSITQTFVALRNAVGQRGHEPFGQSAEEVPPE